MKLDRDSRIEERRLKTVQKTDGNKRLLRIWKKSPYADVRAAVIYKLKDQAALSHIAQNETMDELRCEAVRKLKDKALLAKIANEDGSQYVRFIAERKFEFSGNKQNAMQNMDEDIAQAFGMIFEYNAHLERLATGAEESEDIW